MIISFIDEIFGPLIVDLGDEAEGEEVEGYDRKEKDQGA